MSHNDIALMAHLMRRAGFSARREELEEFAARDYDSVVEELLDPEGVPEVETDVLHRYLGGSGGPWAQGEWIYRMLNSKRQLQEKMALFWHHVLATGSEKSGDHVQRQIDKFRRICMSDVHTILTELSLDPAMLMWLDNQENMKAEPNENYGRELLELFSMGVGNYTEDDVKGSTQAFTGWSFLTPIPHGGSQRRGNPSKFRYLEREHDEGEKEFLGESGRFNGEDIIDVIAKQPATARFISRHLYTFFVADEPNVASWNEIPPQDPDAIDTLVAAYFDSGGELRPILRVLFNSEFFKAASYKRVKSPTELVTGVLKLVDTYRYPEPGFPRIGGVIGQMGQRLLNPLTVEGFHTGQEWIDGGTLNGRINFAVNEVADASKPGVQGIVRRLAADGGSIPPADFVARCLDLAGPMVVGGDTRGGLMEYAESGGDLRFDTSDEQATSQERVVRMLQLIVSTREYQFG